MKVGKYKLILNPRTLYSKTPIYVYSTDICHTITMSSISPNATSAEKFAKYYRQKCINLLEKMTKNCFRMFRDETTTKEQLLKRFFELKEKLDKL